MLTPSVQKCYTFTTEPCPVEKNCVNSDSEMVWKGLYFVAEGLINQKAWFTVSISSSITYICIPLFVYYSFKINDTSRWDLELVQICYLLILLRYFSKQNTYSLKSYAKFCAKYQYFGQYFKNLTEILHFSKLHFKFWDKTLNIMWILRNWHHSWNVFFNSEIVSVYQVQKGHYLFPLQVLNLFLISVL